MYEPTAPRRAFPTGPDRTLSLDGHRLAIANQKGGVGKTTTAVNLGASVADAGYPTLLVDLDPQCNATVALGLPKDGGPNVYDCLAGDLDARRRGAPERHRAASTSCPPRPSSPAPTSSCRASPAPRRCLRDRLGSVRDRYLFTLLDCPPSLGPLTVNALVAADSVIVPVQTEYFALEGLAAAARHALADPARAQPAAHGRRDDPDDARRAHAARARRRARGARALPVARLRHRHSAQRPPRRGAELRPPGAAARARTAPAPPPT